MRAEHLFYTDSHAHLTADPLYENRKELLKRAQEAGVQALVNICTNLITLERGLELSKHYPWIYQAAATTPHDVATEGEAVFETIANCARKGQLCAVGETGLDYHYEHSNRTIQQNFLRRYFHLALECNLPVIIHCREAFNDFFQILDAEYRVNTHPAPGVLHCFTGTQAEADAVVERGWMLSLSGIVTFKKSLELHEVAKNIPLENLLIETDAPYLAPQKHRGQTNEPAFIIETAAYIAALKQVPVEIVQEATTLNAQKIFKFKP